MKKTCEIIKHYGCWEIKIGSGDIPDMSLYVDEIYLITPNNIASEISMDEILKEFSDGI